MTNKREIKCPYCPWCGSPPPFIADQMYQAFCPNEDCEVLMWVPWDTAKQNLEDAHEAVFTSTDLDNSEYDETPQRGGPAE